LQKAKSQRWATRHDEAAIDRHLLALDQARRHALLYNALKQLLKQVRQIEHCEHSPFASVVANENLEIESQFL